MVSAVNPWVVAEATPQQPTCAAGPWDAATFRKAKDAAALAPAVSGLKGPCRAEISFVLNGEPVTVANADPNMLLSDYIRDVAGLKGTKVYCYQGGCGACTVVMAPLDAAPGGGGDGALVHRPINACLRPLAAVDGMAITTVEGVGTKRTGLHAVQQRIVEQNGTQCGFCTPGFVTNMYGFLQDNPKPSPQAVEDQFSGNLCRCTGYRPILDAFQSFTCDKSLKHCAVGGAADIEEIAAAAAGGLSHCHVSPPPARPLRVSSGGTTWWKLHSLEDLCQLYQAYPDLRMVAGNTMTGVYAARPVAVLADISEIPELRKVEVTSGAVVFGGGVPISDFERTLAVNEGLSPSFPALLLYLKRVANKQVCNVGSLAGNLVMTNQHPGFVSDMAVLLFAAGAAVTLLDLTPGGRGTSTVSVEQFLATDLRGLVVTAVSVPILPAGEFVTTLKVAMRRVNSHAIVNAGFRFDADRKTGLIRSRPTIVYGGVRKYPVRAPKTEAFLEGKSFKDPQVVQQALKLVSQELEVDPFEGKSKYRASLVPAFLYKALLRLWPADELSPALRTAATEYDRPISKGDVSFDTDPSEYPVSKPLPKLSAAIQTTGEAVYTDDIEGVAGELHAALALTTHGNAAIDAIDASEALRADGVQGFVSAATLARDGLCNAVSEHENLFATKRSLYCGQAVGLILADTKRQAEAAAKLVKVTYSDERKPILTLEDAIAAGSWLKDSKKEMKTGGLPGSSDALKKSEVVVEGEVSIGHQYHFHLESQRAICIPGEDGEMKIYSSTQNVSQVQQVVAAALNVPQSKVSVSVKRIGGAYGSKINRATPVAMAAAVAAAAARRPVRLVMGLSTNMQNVGARSPYMCRYKIGVTKGGLLTAIHMRIYNNHGAHYDMDYPDMGGFFVFLDSVYKCAAWDVEAICARTNLPACTYMRGPGFVEANFIVESAMEHVANALGMAPDVFRRQNFYTSGDISPSGQHLGYCNARLVFDRVKESSGYAARVAGAKEFNARSRWVKRGVSLVPLRFGLGWNGCQFMTLITIFTDGSIRILQSGVELGQGLDVKVAQVAAMELGQLAKGGCPTGEIQIGPTSSDTNNNTMSTGGSITSELSAMAVQEACKILVERLRPSATVLASERDGEKPTWHELIATAVGLGVDLQARGRVYPSTPDTFKYMSYGAAVTEAEVDVLTGDSRLLRCDLLLDCGKSLNPAVDIGQVQGAYVMGLGYHLTEEFIYDEETGKLLSDGTWEYKPPSHKDIPHVFNAALLQNSGNPSGFLRSKASGEPPYAMAASALLAVRAAVAAGRAQFGDAAWVPLSSPATVEKTAMAASVPVSLLRL